MLSDEIVFDLSPASNNALVVFKDGRIAARILDDGYPYDEDITNSKLAQFLRPVLLKAGLLEAKFLEAALLEGPLNVTLHNVMNGMNEKKSNNNNLRAGSAEQKIEKNQDKGNEGKAKQGLLSEKVKETLLTSGIDPDAVRYFDSLNGCASALNDSTNPVKAAQTMMGKDTFPARLTDFLKKSSAAAVTKQFRDTIPEKYEKI